MMIYNMDNIPFSYKPKSYISSALEKIAFGQCSLHSETCRIANAGINLFLLHHGDLIFCMLSAFSLQCVSKQSGRGANPIYRGRNKLVHFGGIHCGNENIHVNVMLHKHSLG